ncbi:MAG: deoxyribose-phosphate aldolase [Phycisphaeraceae bacterium]|nr:deoxyribose-phosphate aldolase [Phycisphaeraceae bacterium]
MPHERSNSFDEASWRRSPPVDTVMATRRAAFFTTRSIKNDSKRVGLRLALSMVDLTTLEGKDTPEKVRALCRKAVRPYEGEVSPPIPSVAAICVYPNLVPVAKRALEGSSVKVAAVATGFPSGQYPLAVRLADVRAAVADGADEIDMVISRGALLAGRFREVADEIVETRKACGPAHLKIILETGELETLDMVRRASDLAIHAAASAGPIGDGEVFIKTSTGKVQPAATMPVTLVMLEAIRDHFRHTGVRIGMKPAGGIRTAKQSLHYLVMVKETLGEAWLTPSLFRFGASALANDLLRQIVKLERGVYMAATDFSEA